MLATRALELGDGSLPKTKLEKGKSYLTKDYVKVAMDELENGKLPLEIFKKEE